MIRDSRRSSPALRSQRGFSFIELLMATLLMGYAIASLDAVFMAGKHKVALNSDPLTARLLANEIRLLAQLLPSTPSGSTGAMAPDEVLALDSLDGAVFSPPILANLEEYEGLDDWTQSVSVRVAALDDPSAAGTDLPEEGLDEESQSLYEIQVSISYLQEDAGSWTWWVRP